MYSAIFFDRDGIINKYVTPTPRTKAEIIINDGIKETIQKLKKLGYAIIIVTNQPDIKRGLITKKDSEEIATWLQEELCVDFIYISASTDDDDVFRKPNPGMLLAASEQHDIHLPSSFIIGDSWKDIEAGKRAGCGTIFLATEYNVNDYDIMEQKGIKFDFPIQSLDCIYDTVITAAYDRHYFDTCTKTIHNNLRPQRRTFYNILLQLGKVHTEDGRVFVLGVGGGAGNASHAVADLRKVCGIEAYSVTDNVSELTARINDESWEDCYKRYLETSHLSDKDAVLVFSVGGGNKEHGISENIINALDYAKEKGAYICGVVGRDGGYTKQVANDCVIIQVDEPSMTTPIVESMQAVVWHMLVTHPYLQMYKTTWESVDDISRQQ